MADIDERAAAEIGPGEGVVTESGPVGREGKPQWYELNPTLQRAEIEAMRQFAPDATWQILPDGRMCWVVPIHPDGDGIPREWTLLATYDADHPQRRWGGSVRYYPVSPSYDEMRELVAEAGRITQRIPHMLLDGQGIPYLSLYVPIERQRKDWVVVTAASLLRHAKQWISDFEMGLVDSDVWERLSWGDCPSI